MSSVRLGAGPRWLAPRRHANQWRGSVAIDQRQSTRAATLRGAEFRYQYALGKRLERHPRSRRRARFSISSGST